MEKALHTFWDYVAGNYDPHQPDSSVVWLAHDVTMTLTKLTVV